MLLIVEVVLRKKKDRGWRGDRLDELLCEVGLEICNDVHLLPHEIAWTFRSCLGTKRTLDYCMVSSGMSVTSSKSVNALQLRSDHRAVQSCVLLPSEVRPRRRQARKKKTDWHKFAEVAKEYECNPTGNIQGFGKELYGLAHMCEEIKTKSPDCPWDSSELKILRDMRRSTENVEERKNISKKIWRKTRDQLRQYRTKQVQEKLTEFSKLESLGKMHLYPITKTHTIGPNLQACANLLQQVYTSENEAQYSDNYSVPAFTFGEVKHAIKCMRKGRCCDKDGMFLEMFLHCGDKNLQLL